MVIGSVGAGAEAAAGGVHQRAEGGGLEGAVLAEQGEDLLAGREQHRHVLGQLGGGEARQAVLAGAEHLALAAQGQVDLGQLEAVALRRDGAQPAAGELSRLFGEQQAEGACSPLPTLPRSWCSWETP